MKKQILAVVAVLALSAVSAFAAPKDGVVGSVHDMKASVNGVDSQERICAFCHTPHHATDADNAAPLWSRPVNTNTYTAYLSGTLSGITDPAAGPTKLCLSCHDSNLAVDSHYGIVGTTSVPVKNGFGGADIGNEAGTASLMGTHPVGFSYDTYVCGSSPNVNTVITPGTCGTIPANLDAPTTASNKNYVRQYGDNGELRFLGNESITVKERLYVRADGERVMTCATCHDVHNKINSDLTGAAIPNYLILAPQAGSKLCLTCHIK